MSTSQQTMLKFPALLEAAEKVSAEQQRNFYLATATQISALALASAAALLPGEFGDGFGPIATLICFLGALILQISGVAKRSEQRWYDARAASESVKSASWQFAVAGEAFRLDDAQAEDRFSRTLEDILQSLPSLNIGANGTRAVVTSEMRLLRAASLTERAEVYGRERVDDQMGWYSSKSAWNKARAHWYGIAIVAVEAVAITLGLLRVRGSVDLDFMSVLAATAAGIIAWVQTKKYSTLAEAYAVTSHEVSRVRSSLIDTSEHGWAQSVHDAEAAFSREHTMWRARRQGPV